MSEKKVNIMIFLDKHKKEIAIGLIASIAGAAVSGCISLIIASNQLAQSEEIFNQQLEQSQQLFKRQVMESIISNRLNDVENMVFTIEKNINEMTNIRESFYLSLVSLEIDRLTENTNRNTLEEYKKWSIEYKSKYLETFLLINKISLILDNDEAQEICKNYKEFLSSNGIDKIELSTRFVEQKENILKFIYDGSVDYSFEDEMFSIMAIEYTRGLSKNYIETYNEYLDAFVREEI